MSISLAEYQLEPKESQIPHKSSVSCREYFFIRGFAARD
jgi:hypothetical protein